MKSLTAPAFAHFPKDWHLSPILDCGDFVFFSGVTGYRPDGVVAADPAEQFDDAFGFLKDNLAAAGLGFDRVVELTTYHVDLQHHIESFIRVKDRYIVEPYPAWTAIGITELITPGTIIEIRAIAKR